MKRLFQRGASVRDRLVREVDSSGSGAVDWGGAAGSRERNREERGYLVSSVSFPAFWAIHSASSMPYPSIARLRSSFSPSTTPPL